MQPKAVRPRHPGAYEPRRAYRGLVAAFGRWLNSLSERVQILVRAERVDLASTIGALEERIPQLPHPALAHAAREHAMFLTDLLIHLPDPGNKMINVWAVDVARRSVRTLPCPTWPVRPDRPFPSMCRCRPAVSNRPLPGSDELLKGRRFQ
ncbi:hypothetical protein F5972_12150 [Microbispora cellulosiformans]|uniref:Uncharacterized protein n=1 Tax=Microbispora cellulosiformans TaxID=2614688 RepID=A0A5J5K3I7_9ACTN|nr:hypothetical protein [Microbispora cellulosiformans]KAA9378977.1 hypothetical protein F5972_12150 [Microbispora cellulosiformans]